MTPKTEITINVPKGYKIDKEKSDLETGRIVFEKVGATLSKGWDEFCYNNENQSREFYIGSNSDICQIRSSSAKRSGLTERNSLPSKEYAEAFLALMQLITIREKEYTREWKPDWSTDEDKFVIENFCGKAIVIKTFSSAGALSFKTEQSAKDFLRIWGDLIDKAKILI